MKFNFINVLPTPFSYKSLFKAKLKAEKRLSYVKFARLTLMKLLTGDRDLKVSIGTGESNGPATTWHVVTSSSSSQKKSGKPDFREEIVLDASKELNKKIYFLATGNGCSTLQVNTQ